MIFSASVFLTQFVQKFFLERGCIFGFFLLYYRQINHFRLFGRRSGNRGEAVINAGFITRPESYIQIIQVKTTQM